MKKPYKIGIVFGCFIPMHKGHEILINNCINSNDKTIIAVCGFDDDRGKDFIPFKDRYLLTKYAYPNNNVIVVDDKKLGLDGTFTSDNWLKWMWEIFNQSKINPYDESIRFLWYTGEPSYVEKMQVLFPKHQFSVADRDDIKISGTKIRESPEKYINYINNVFKGYLIAKNILK